MAEEQQNVSANHARAVLEVIDKGYETVTTPATKHFAPESFDHGMRPEAVVAEVSKIYPEQALGTTNNAIEALKAAGMVADDKEGRLYSTAKGRGALSK